MEIYELTGSALTEFLDELGAVDAAKKIGIHTVRVAIDEGTLKVKVNEFCWSPPLTTRKR